MDLRNKITAVKYFLDGVLGLQYGSLNEILKILKKLTVLQ